MQTVVEMNHYAARAGKLLTAEEREAIVTIVACDPLCGDVIPGAAGISKLRFAKAGRGKSGGVRVIYYYYNGVAPVFLFSLFGKNEKDNLSKAEQGDLAQLAMVVKKGFKGK
jgi:hypothetical protein